MEVGWWVKTTRILLFFFNNFICLLLVVRRLYCCVGFSLVAAGRGYSSFRCAGFSFVAILLLQSRALGHSEFRSWGSQDPEHRLGSCGTQAWLFRGMCGLPGPGIKSVSPALTGGSSTTEAPGKPPPVFSTESGLPPPPTFPFLPLEAGRQGPALLDDYLSSDGS